MMLQGSMVALVTPMHLDGSVDEPSLRRLVDFHVENQTQAIVAVGTTGESATLNFDEHCAVIKCIVEQAAGQIPVIAGTGANSTQEALELTECAKNLGADACLLVTPYYNKPTQEGLYLHYKKIAETVDIPQLLYNVPARTACDMLPETVARLASIPNIIGIKEAMGDMQRIKAVTALARDDFIVLSGDDATAMELMLAGGQGVISVTANVAPQIMQMMCIQAITGDRAGATAINANLEGLHRHLFDESNPIPVKWALQQMGMITEGIRLPLTPLSPRYRDFVQQALLQANVL